MVKNCKVLGEELEKLGVGLVSGGSENHLLLLKTDSMNLSGKEAEAILESIEITCNKNMIPKDTRSPFVTSGLRIGTPAITTRGLKEEHMIMLAEWIHSGLTRPTEHERIKAEVKALCKQFPVY